MHEFPRAGHVSLPVVIIADLIADGDHEGCTAFIRATIPVTCGQAIEVPDRILNFNFAVAGDQAARMFNPGAATSGYKGKQVINQA